MRKIRPDISVGPGKIRLFFFAGVAGASIHMLTANGAMAGADELYAGAVCAIAAGLATFLTVMHRIVMYIIRGALAGGVAGVAPFIHSIEAGTAVGATVFTAFQLQIENVGVRFGAVTVMTFCAAIIGGYATADADATFLVVIIFRGGRLCGLFRFHRLGFGGFRRLRLGSRFCGLGILGG